jgi:hypothetical protein
MAHQLFSAGDAKILAPMLLDPGDPRLSRFWQSLAEHEALYLSRWRQHRLTPFLYWRMSRQGGAAAFPPGLWQALQEDYAMALGRSYRQEAEVRELLETFHQAGIEVILLKGVDLRQRIYEDPAVRDVDDVDMLIAPTAVRGAKNLLMKRGYQPESSSRNWYSNLREVFSYYCKFYPPEGKGLPLDLHWALQVDVSVDRISFAELYDSAQPLVYQGVPARGLSPEHLLFHLCFHALGHSLHYTPGTSVLGQKFLDIREVLRRLPMDWPRFLQEVQKFGAVPQVSCLLEELALLDEALMPEWVLTALRQHPAAGRQAALWRLQKAIFAALYKVPGTHYLQGRLEMTILFASFLRTRLRAALFRGNI